MTNSRKFWLKAVARFGVVSALLIGVTWVGWQLSNSRTRQLFGTFVTHVNTPDSVIALTFDDGPTIPYTDSVLAVLAEYDVPATFFAVGAALARQPAVTARIVAAGHELGNHSYSHRRMVLKTPGFVRREIEETDSLIQAAGQSWPAPFRPPYFKRLVILPWYLARTDRPAVLADIEPDSYLRDSTAIVRHVLERVRPGSIIVLHVEVGSRLSSRAALPALIARLRDQGYTFVTVSELLRRAER